ncbi:MAG: 2-succinyl-5-enolpyruvyl-6-hydroxy-3-cyclohexene-1-carboxylic-acid synthase [Prevotella sp.]|nr:2-succinyl-5-enolpyruvyl-6-hydroxy-3-cyclohexene-1-carboxylic-acid synthase [Prevotella sp.]
MYSNKENVNILTALLVAHGVRRAVVCPGSRNAPIVHNLDECPHISCLPVTDERSAGFFALGLAQATDEPVAVCVTSGTALLNLLPAVAEACHQHVSLIVVSADRPAAWIGQMDGQTLHQPGALEPWVAKSVTLPEPDRASEAEASTARWHCNRLVNEALLEAWQDHRPCVHINVPISEPLFQFTTGKLSAERVIHRYAPPADYSCLCAPLLDDLTSAQRPMVVFGQMAPDHFDKKVADYLFSHVIVLHEQLAAFPSVSHFDEVLAAAGNSEDAIQELLPDFVLYVGGTLVSKRLKAFLRRAANAHVWRVSPTGTVEDTFQNLRSIVTGDAEFTLNALSEKLARQHWSKGLAYRRQWLKLLQQASNLAQTYAPPYSQMAAVKQLEQRLERLSDQEMPVVHYANSSAIRLANIYARHHVWCNRGVNGIEGSVSTAAGFAAATDDDRMVVCVAGDLSFFYDQNALWNQNLRGNLRILLLNNGKGAIFDLLPGLEQSPARDRLVSACHQTSAEGICRQNGIGYLAARNADELEQGLDWLLSPGGDRPTLLEVFTSAQADTNTYADYYKWICNGIDS